MPRYRCRMKKITDYNDPAALRRVRKNALDMADDALRHLSLLEAGKQPDKMHTDYYQALAAYEQLLIETVSPSARARRTREALAKRSLQECLEEWAGAKTPTRAFELLTKFGLVDMTAERIVLRYPEHFSAKTLETSRKRLAELGH
jgi:hypothetical protein